MIRGGIQFVINIFEVPHRPDIKGKIPLAIYAIAISLAFVNQYLAVALNIIVALM